MVYELQQVRAKPSRFFLAAQHVCISLFFFKVCLISGNFHVALRNVSIAPKSSLQMLTWLCSSIGSTTFRGWEVQLNPPNHTGSSDSCRWYIVNIIRGVFIFYEMESLVGFYSWTHNSFLSVLSAETPKGFSWESPPLLGPPGRPQHAQGEENRCFFVVKTLDMSKQVKKKKKVEILSPHV